MLKINRVNSTFSTNQAHKSKIFLFADY